MEGGGNRAGIHEVARTGGADVLPVVEGDAVVDFASAGAGAGVSCSCEEGGEGGQGRLRGEGTAKSSPLAETSSSCGTEWTALGGESDMCSSPSPTALFSPGRG